MYRIKNREVVVPLCNYGKTPLKIPQNLGYEEIEEIKEISRISVTTSGGDQETRVQDLLKKTRLDHIEESERSNLWKIITGYHDIYNLEGESFPGTSLVEHEIKLKTGK